MKEVVQRGGEVRTVGIENPPIELGRILKLEGLVQSGGEAKHVIADGLVSVNGEVETRRRKKILPGDWVEFSSVRIEIVEVNRDV